MVKNDFPGTAPPSADALKAASLYIQLLILQIKFLYPYLRNVDLPKNILTLYKVLIFTWIYLSNYYYFFSISGYSTGFPSDLARFSRTSLWIPFRSLWCSSTKLHSIEKSRSLRLSKAYEIAESINSRVQGKIDDDVRIQWLMTKSEFFEFFGDFDF